MIAWAMAASLACQSVPTLASDWDAGVPVGTTARPDERSTLAQNVRIDLSTPWLEWFAEIDARSSVFADAAHALFAGPALLVEGLSWLLLPNRR